MVFDIGAAHCSTDGRLCSGRVVVADQGVVTNADGRLAFVRFRCVDCPATWEWREPPPRGDVARVVQVNP
jgi:hypothetical protein